MPRLRLTGLFLFITTLCIGMAAAASNTTHIRFKRFDDVVAAEQGVAESELTPEQIQFMSVPIIYPLFGVGTLGLMLWFVPGADLSGGKKKTRRSSSRRSSKSRRTPWSLTGRKRSRR